MKKFQISSTDTKKALKKARGKPRKKAESAKSDREGVRFVPGRARLRRLSPARHCLSEARASAAGETSAGTVARRRDPSAASVPPPFSGEAGCGDCTVNSKRRTKRLPRKGSRQPLADCGAAPSSEASRPPKSPPSPYLFNSSIVENSGFPIKITRKTGNVALVFSENTKYNSM